ncbi:MAG: outer membrane beta-barrel protein [Pseudomonadota bacterium]
MLKKIIPLTLMTLFATSANATNFSYSSFGLELSKIDVDELPEDLNGYGINASLELNENVFLLASYRYADEEMVISGYDVDLSSDIGKIGIGAATALTNQIDAFATFSYATTLAEACISGRCVEADDDGYFLTGGLRSWITNSIDVIGTVTYAELDKSDWDGTAYGLGIGFWPARSHRLGFAIEHSEDAQAAIVSYSFYPGQ